MSDYFPTTYQSFIYTSRYARWNDEDGRREVWPETVDRYLNYISNHLFTNNNYEFSNELKNKIRDSILNLKVMPSMRALMTAGPALDRDNVAGYNCSYLPIDSPLAFDEAMYILLCGTGVGFSVERQYIQKLPEVPEKLFDSNTTIVVSDSKAGWAKSYRQLLALLYSGEVPKWDISKVRPAGARLKTFGGRASGPRPLEELFRFTINKFRNAAGRRLNSLECHDLMCKIGEVVVVGGVRRSAMISLSNLSDLRMQGAKTGEWYKDNVQRALSNNSVAYTERPDIGTFLREWTNLYESKSGERGVFNRYASQRKVRTIGRRDESFEFGTNPCSEIILRPYQFCNLTEVVVRVDDTYETLEEKVFIATILGTIQSTLTYFPYLRKIWKTNTEEERLLGVSLTGIMDSPLLNTVNNDLPILLQSLKEYAVEVNKEFSAKLGIQQSTAITCVKPSGTVSQLVDSASGIHTRHSPYYIRTVRVDKKDPVSKFLKDFGVKVESDVTKPDAVDVFYFPVKAPEGAVVREDRDAIAQLELWKIYNEHWCEHKPSVTISVKDNEWMDVGAWVYKNFDIVSGISFLPFSEHIYQQAPYQECTVEEYNKLLEQTPDYIDWTVLQLYEREDTTTGSQTLACSADSCEVVDLVS